MKFINMSHKDKRVLTIVIVLLVVGFFVAENTIGYNPSHDYLHDIKQNVAYDAVQQYEMAARGGDKMQMYSQASLCVAAYLQAKDEENYRKWLAIQHDLAKQLNIPNY
jgi:hypothetical protein